MRRSSRPLFDLDLDPLRPMTHRIARFQSTSHGNAGRALARAVTLSFAFVAAFAVTSSVAYATADDVASLYGPQPPADATYLRVVNLSRRAASVALPSGARVAELPAGGATALDVLRPGTPLNIEVDGTTPARQAGAVTVASSETAGATITVAIDRDGANGWRSRSVAAAGANVDALRAQLRLVNFVDGCDGEITLDRSAASIVFEHVASGHAAARSINPVAATLVARCAGAVSAPFALPRLAAGRSYTLILSGTSARPVLGGVPDTLEWPGAR
jgi:alginate O-acetyltransferase complex protein AlgF